MGILTQKKRESERGKERAKEKPAGYCVSLQDPKTKAPPRGEIWKVWGWRGEGSQGWRMGLKYNPKG